MQSIIFSESVDIAGLLIRATVLLATGIVFTLLLRRFAAQIRHQAWTILFLVLLLLPLGMKWLPTWDIAVLPAPEYASEPGTIPVPLADESLPLEARVESGLVEAYAPSPGEDPAVSSAYVAGDIKRDVLDSRSLIFGFWLLGAGLALLSLLVAKLRFLWITHNAQPVLDPDWMDQLGTLKRRLGITREVRLLMSRSVTTPMTSGSFRPIILVPDEALTWTADRIEVVLAHELIHIHRYDALRHLVSRITLSMYWFHPLSWFASRMAAVSREQACDAEVLLLGTKPSSYANQLLALADNMTVEPSYAVLPMIRKSQLENRLMAILDPNRPRKNILSSAIVFLSLSVLGIATVIARPVSFDATPSELSGVSLDAVAMTEPLQQATQPVLPASPPETPVQETAPVPPVADRAPEPVSVKPVPPEKAPVPERAESDDYAWVHTDQQCEVSSTGKNGEKFIFRGSFSTKAPDGTKRNEYSGVQNSDRVVQTFVDGVRLCMRVHGAMEVNDDGTLTVSMNPLKRENMDSWAIVEAQDSKLYRMVITGSESIERTWSIDGDTMPVDDKAEIWLHKVVRILNNFSESSKVKGAISNYQGEVEALKGKFSSIEGSTSTYGNHVDVLRGEIAKLHIREEVLLAQIEDIKRHDSDLLVEIAALKAESKRLEAVDQKENEEASLQAKVRIDELQLKREELGAASRVEELRRQKEEFNTDERVREYESKIKALELEGRAKKIKTEVQAIELEKQLMEANQSLKRLDAENVLHELDKDIEKQFKEVKSLMRSM